MRTPEPKGKLDATTTHPAARCVGHVDVVNGPEGEPLDWHAIDWRAAEGTVRRLRQRIFTASQAGDLKRVCNLQKLMLRSRANTLLSVRRVTERNAGRATPGVDGEVTLTPEAKVELADWVQRSSEPWTVRPVKRVYIPKRGTTGRRRPLGVPVIVDRVLQARVVNALEPEWEARFEPRSYGFRPGRGCQDAIGATYLTVKGPNPARRWVLDADLAAAFDRIDQSFLLGQLGTFPARGLIADWLKAGVIENGRFAPTEEGTPQGGVMTPPTQWATSSSRSPFRTGEQNGRVEMLDMKGSISMSHPPGKETVGFTGHGSRAREGTGRPVCPSSQRSGGAAGDGGRGLRGGPAAGPAVPGLGAAGPPVRRCRPALRPGARAQGQGGVHREGRDRGGPPGARVRPVDGANHQRRGVPGAGGVPGQGAGGSPRWQVGGSTANTSSTAWATRPWPRPTGSSSQSIAGG